MLAKHWTIALLVAPAVIAMLACFREPVASTVRVQRELPEPTRATNHRHESIKQRPNADGLEQATAILGGLAKEWNSPGQGTRDDELIKALLSVDVSMIRRLLSRLDRVAPLEANEDFHRAIVTHLADLHTNWRDCPEKTRVVEQLAELLMISAPETAGRLIFSVETNDTRQRLLDRWIGEWANRDLPAALRWAKDLPPSAEQERCVLQLASKLARRDPAAALEISSTLPQRCQGRLLAVVVQEGKDGPGLVAQWIAKIPEGPRRDQLVAGLAANWATHDPDGAGRFLASLPDGDSQTEAIASVISAWSLREPELMAALLKDFPDGELRRNGIENVAFRWGKTSPTALEYWIGALPGEERDAAIYAAAGGLLETRPDLAADWTLKMNDGIPRQQQMKRAARRWLEVDPEEAIAWIGKSGFSVETKISLFSEAR